MFTTQNTEGFTKEILDKMNSELEDAIANLDKDSLDYDDQVQNIEQQIFNKYC
jgi:hypothetical protein